MWGGKGLAAGMLTREQVGHETSKAEARREPLAQEEVEHFPPRRLVRWALLIARRSMLAAVIGLLGSCLLVDSHRHIACSALLSPGAKIKLYPQRSSADKLLSRRDRTMKSPSGRCPRNASSKYFKYRHIRGLQRGTGPVLLPPVRLQTRKQRSFRRCLSPIFGGSTVSCVGSETVSQLAILAEKAGHMSKTLIVRGESNAETTPFFFFFYGNTHLSQDSRLAQSTKHSQTPKSQH